MPLKYPSAWRFSQSKDASVPDSAISDCFDLIGKVVAQGDRLWCLEQFKSFFANAVGSTNCQSSSESWAQTDLLVYMQELASNPPLFLEAFYDACESLQNAQYDVPDVELVNDICRNYGIKYQIHPPNLIRLGENEEIISMPDSPPNLAESNIQLLHESFRNAEQSLTQERPREAVYEML